MTRFVAPRELFRSGKLLVFIGAGTSDATIPLRGEHFPGQKEIDETFQILPASRDPNGDEVDRGGAHANQLVRLATTLGVGEHCQKNKYPARGTVTGKATVSRSFRGCRLTRTSVHYRVDRLASLMS